MSLSPPSVHATYEGVIRLPWSFVHISTYPSDGAWNSCTWYKLRGATKRQNTRKKLPSEHILTRPLRHTPTQEYVVPKSIPIQVEDLLSSSFFGSLASAVFCVWRVSSRKQRFFEIGIYLHVVAPPRMLREFWNREKLLSILSADNGQRWAFFLARKDKLNFFLHPDLPNEDTTPVSATMLADTLDCEVIAISTVSISSLLDAFMRTKQRGGTYSFRTTGTCRNLLGRPFLLYFI